MKTAFSRRGPDIVTEELAAVLSKSGSFEFKPLFEVLHTNLRARNAASGGEEMLRLRAYEKLQALVHQGIVTKTDKKYKGVASALGKFLATAAELNAKFAAGIQSRTPVHAEAAAKVSAAKEEAVESKTSASITPPKGSKIAKAKLPVRKTKKGLGQEGQEGGEAAA